MVEVTTYNRTVSPTAGYEVLATSQGVPQIHVHSIRREVFGNEISITVMGEIKIAAGEYVWAKELKLNTLQVIVFTPELNRNTIRGYMAQKAIWHKGEYGNYASVDVYADNGTWEGPGTGPVDGSIWLDFVALGE